MKKLFLPLLLLLTPAVAHAAAIDIFSAPDQYQNGGVNPCIFSGNGQNGCNQLLFAFPDFVQSTQVFSPNPLVQTYGDSPGELLQFATNVGRDFFLGLDVNQGGDLQTLTNMTITFLDVNGNPIGSGYTLGGTPLTVPVTAQGEGYTDYVASAGCSGPIVGSGVSEVCLGQAYTPFSAPAGTRQLVFTFGMGTFNDGAERLFLITAGPTPTPFDEDPPPAPVPEPASMVLLGTGLLFAARKRLSRH